MEQDSPAPTASSQVEAGGHSIDYPLFSPPDTSASAPLASLPDPLLSLPAETSGRNKTQFDQQQYSQPVLQYGPPPSHTGQPALQYGPPPSHTGRPVLNTELFASVPIPTASLAGRVAPGTVSAGQVRRPPEWPGNAGGHAVVSSALPAAAGTLGLRVQYMETVCADLQKEKKVMEEQFGQQRKKFMNLMVQKDTELSVVKKSVEQFSSEAQRLGQQLRLKEDEILDMETAAKLVQATNREAFDVDRVKYEEEIASLRRIIDVERSEQQWEREALLGLKAQRSPSPGDPNLEGKMVQAANESKVLKAVVVPLEEEIDMLKAQLVKMKEQLVLCDLAQRQSTPPLIDLDTPIPSQATPLSSAAPGNLSPCPSDGSKLQHQLELERSSRHDLEMHTKALELQKATLQEESAALQKTVEDLNEELTAQQESYQQLQQTWEMANQHFIVAQDQLRQQMYYQQQKQLLLQPQQPASRSTSPYSSDVAPRGEELMASSHQSASTVPLTASRRCHSWGELREREGSSQPGQLQIQALESELKRVRRQLEQRSAMCESYEAQLQRVQEQMLEELEEKDRELGRLREECSKARAGLMRERKVKEELRRRMEEAREQFTTQVERFQAGTQTLQGSLRTVKEQYTDSKHEAQRELAKFSDERIHLYSQISAAQDEYDCLKVLQAEEAETYAQHLSKKKQEQEVLEGQLAEIRSRLASVQGERAVAEHSLGSQLAQLKEQLLSEQRDKQKQELNLSRQLKAAKAEIAALEQMKEELSQEQQMREEEKSRQFIEEQHQRLRSEVEGRQAAEQQVRELQRQVSSLRSHLNTSQETQKDFVELSQSLQVKLAQIEEQQQSHPPPHPS